MRRLADFTPHGRSCTLPTCPLASVTRAKARPDGAHDHAGFVGHPHARNMKRTPRNPAPQVPATITPRPEVPRLDGVAVARLAHGIVDSAIDFLSRAVRGIERSPKYSCIDFCAGLELLLKARLMREHWSLIVADSRAVSAGKLLSGDFQSVAMDDALRRVHHACGEVVPQDEVAAYAAIRRRRNNAVHFFDGAMTAEEATRYHDGTIADQCRAWHFLDRRLRSEWSVHFAAHSRKIERLRTRLLGLRRFLKASFEALTPELDQRRKAGDAVVECEACGFEAAPVQPVAEPISKAACLVCSFERTLLDLPCPECATRILSVEGTSPSCSKCGCVVDLSWLLDKYDLSDRAGGDGGAVYCGECGEISTPTVIPMGAHHGCLNCYRLLAGVQHCGWCHTAIAGVDLEGSGYMGCSFCPGARGDD